MLPTLTAARGYYTVHLGRCDFEIDTRYQNLKPIGRGAYGLVASAEDLLTGQKVAIKRIGRLFHDLVDAKRILREVKLLRHLGRNEHVVDILDIMTSPPASEDFHTLYVVTQLLECDLERIITSPQPLTDQHIQYFMFQLLRGLQYIHSARVLHRDLKPSNVLVNSNCDLAICDFGLARGVSPTGDSKLTEYVVTRWYRAPELLCESEVYGTPVDVWSAGCIFAELLTRTPFFRGSSTRQQLEVIVTKVGAPGPDELASTGVAPALAEVLRGPAGARPPPPFASLFPPTANPVALDLLRSMLEFSQYKRITVSAALEHPYFKDFATPGVEAPSCPVAFNWSFESDHPDAMPVELLQRHMWGEMMKVLADQERMIKPMAPGEFLAVLQARTEAAAAAAAARPGDAEAAATAASTAAALRAAREALLAAVTREAVAAATAAGVPPTVAAAAAAAASSGAASTAALKNAAMVDDADDAPAATVIAR